MRQLGVSDFEKNCIFGILIKNCTKYQLAIKIRDVAGTPNILYLQFSQQERQRVADSQRDLWRLVETYGDLWRLVESNGDL